MKFHLSFYALLGMLWLMPASADPSRSEATLGSNLAGLLDYAREHSPELTATRYESEAARQRAEAVDALPDPVLRTELLDITKQGTQRPTLLPSQVEGARFLLMQTVPWWGKRDLQHGLASAQAAQAEGQTAASWTELAARIKTAYAMEFFLAESERLTQHNMELLRKLEEISTTRYANGLGTQQEVIRVQVETSNLHGELIALQSERHHTHVQLNSLLARPVNAPLVEASQLRALPSPAQLDEAALLEKLHAHNPQLQIADAALQSADKSRELTYNNRYPGVTLGVAPTQSGNAVRSWDLMLEFSIPLQQSSRRAQEREAEAMLSAAQARKQAALNRLESELSENLSALESARHTDALIATRLLPQSELTLQSALAGYETGKVDFAALIEAQRQTLQARQQKLKAQLEMQLRLANIERLLGEEL